MPALTSFFLLPFRMICIALINVITVLFIMSCATIDPISDKENLDYKSRTTTISETGIHVSASVLSADESLNVYGVPLAKKGIQPVWIKVENDNDIAYWLMSAGLDPNFFLTSEAVQAFTSDVQSDSSKELEQHFESQAFRNPIPPNKTISGFILTQLDEGVKTVHVDLVASGQHKSFSIFTLIPGFPSDFEARKYVIDDLYADNEIINYTDDDLFRAALEALPCCVTNKKGTKKGDPLNLVIVGGKDDAIAALVRRGWRPTEQTWYGSVLKMVNSALSAERYPYAPISPLYLYNRPQDFSSQKARDNIHQRNHLRLWLSPMRFHGRLVWVGQISRDIGTRLTIHSPYLTTHKIDPDVDEARTALQEDMMYSQSLAKTGLVKGVDAAPKHAPRYNLTKDPYYTDGFRAILIFDEHTTALTDIRFLPWEGRTGGFIEQSTHKEK